MNRIETLSPSLLEQTADVALIDRWLSALNWSNGWHYDLDIIWLLNRIRERGLAPGATILDAGAGLGVTQFVLASLGFDVLSLDFSLRAPPRLAKGIFRIDLRQEQEPVTRTEYLDFMTYGRGPGRLGRIVRHPGSLWYSLGRRLRDRWNPSCFRERRRAHDGFGRITFLRGEFNRIPVDSAGVDLLVSVSAFEHNTRDAMAGAAAEFLRVVKPGGAALVTTSLARDDDWYFEPSKGWNLTARSLAGWFGVEEPRDLDFDGALREIRTSPKLRARISPFYRYNDGNGLPFGRLEDARYVPVAVCRSKE